MEMPDVNRNSAPVPLSTANGARQNKPPRCHHDVRKRNMAGLHDRLFADMP